MLSIQHISKDFGNTKALQDITIHFKKGICFGLVGPNGAGKSTLIKIIVGIIQQFEGTVQFDSSNRKEWKHLTGYIPQEICLEENVSAIQNLHLFGKIHNLKGKELHDQTEKVLATIGLTDRKKDKVKTFSGGMKRRLNIGCALMHDPSLIIMDEPTVGVDPQSRKHIWNMVQEMKKENRTIIYSSHYIEEVEKICDEVAFIDHGMIIKQDHMTNLLQNHAVPAVYFSCKENELIIKDVYSFGSVTEYDNGYMLTTMNPMQAMEKILESCKKHKIVLDQFEFVQPNLEDVFFTVTGNELRT